MSSTRTTHHLHGAPLKPSIKHLQTDTTQSNLFILSYSGTETTFFFSDEEDFNFFIKKLASLSQTYLSEKVSS